MKKSPIAFQRNVTKEQLIEICKILYPDINQSEFDKIKFYGKYNWICVEFKLKEGLISFGIDPHHIDGIWGPISFTKAEEIVKNTSFRIWRFVNDYLFEKNKIDDERKLMRGEIYLQQIHPKPSAKEYYNYYMKD